MNELLFLSTLRNDWLLFLSTHSTTGYSSCQHTQRLVTLPVNTLNDWLTLPVNTLNDWLLFLSTREHPPPTPLSHFDIVRG